MSRTHSITYRGPLRYEGHLAAALRDEGADLDGYQPHPKAHEEPGPDDPHEVTITAEGALLAVERACRRFVRLWPTTELELNGERVPADDGRPW